MTAWDEGQIYGASFSPLFEARALPSYLLPPCREELEHMLFECWGFFVTTSHSVLRTICTFLPCVNHNSPSRCNVLLHDIRAAIASDLDNALFYWKIKKEHQIYPNPMDPAAFRTILRKERR